MPKKWFVHTLVIVLFISCSLFAKSDHLIIDKERQLETQALVLLNKKIELKDYPHVFNPSIANTEFGLLMTFRYIPDLLLPSISYIGIVRLNSKSFEPISKPEILNIPKIGHIVPSQGEDARLFSYRGKTYIIYNDSTNDLCISSSQRRDIFIAKVNYIDNHFVLSTPLRLYHSQFYPYITLQKNWVPFEWNGSLLFGYSINPHEVVYANLISGKCTTIYETDFNSDWLYGTMRGGSPALLVDDEYLAFFHSSLMMESSCSPDMARHHYFMGAYTFSSEPPFNFTKITRSPIIAKGFYTNSDAEKRVIFPGGFVYIEPNLILVAYGKDDREIWIAVLDKNRLKNLLIPIPGYYDRATQ